MNIKEYGSWSPYNRDNPKYAGDEFNRSLLKERFDVPNGYSANEVDEYYRVPNMAEAYAYTGKKEEAKQSNQAKQSKNARQLRQNLIRQVVAFAAGSVVIVSSYQSVIRQQASAQPSDGGEANDPAVSYVANWTWSDDNETVTVVLSDSQGNPVKEIAAVVDVSQEDATCNAEGTKTYTATAEENGTTYTDSRSETLPPLGHDFSEGQEVVLANGQTAMTFTCDRCHEEFTIVTSMTEND